MISKLAHVPSAVAISPINGAMLPASFLTGTTKETAGSASFSGIMLLVYIEALLRAGSSVQTSELLMGQGGSGQPF